MTSQRALSGLCLGLPGHRFRRFLPFCSKAEAQASASFCWPASALRLDTHLRLTVGRYNFASPRPPSRAESRRTMSRANDRISKDGDAGNGAHAADGGGSPAAAGSRRQEQRRSRRERAGDRPVRAAGERPAPPPGSLLPRASARSGTDRFEKDDGASAAEPPTTTGSTYALDGLRYAILGVCSSQRSVPG